MKNNCLIVVDMQNDFISGALGTMEAQSIVPKVVERINRAKAEGWHIFVTKDTHFADYHLTMEGEKLPVSHCICGSVGWQLNDDVADALDKYPVNYVHKGAFGSEDLLDELNNCTQIEVIGLCTDICVIVNAILIKTRFSETPIRVDSSCCAGTTPAMHEAALKVMRSCQIEVV